MMHKKSKVKSHLPATAKRSNEAVGRWQAGKSKVPGGFTLLETMVAIAILLIAVITPIGLIGNSLHHLYYARDQMVAVNLAQEGIEGVRQKRDSNLLAVTAGVVGAVWNTGLTQGTYIFDGLTPSLSVCAGCDTKVYKDANGYYGQGVGGASTLFTRSIAITDISVREKQVVSTVAWSTSGQQGTVSVSENIFNWLP